MAPYDWTELEGEYSLQVIKEKKCNNHSGLQTMSKGRFPQERFVTSSSSVAVWRDAILQKWSLHIIQWKHQQIAVVLCQIFRNIPFVLQKKSVIETQLLRHMRRQERFSMSFHFSTFWVISLLFKQLQYGLQGIDCLGNKKPSAAAALKKQMIFAFNVQIIFQRVQVTVQQPLRQLICVFLLQLLQSVVGDFLRGDEGTCLLLIYCICSSDKNKTKG